MSWAKQRRWAEGWAKGLDLVPTSGLVEALRAHKDPGEIARIATAAAIADEALARVRPMLEERPTEVEVATALDAEMRRLGAEGPAFETIVATGPSGAEPHHHPSDRRVSANDLVVLDFGARVDGYHSDMTRTIEGRARRGRPEAAEDGCGGPGEPGRGAQRGQGRGSGSRNRPGLPGGGRSGGHGRTVRARDRSRGRARDPRVTLSSWAIRRYTQLRPGRYCRARRVRPRTGWGPHRGHRLGHGGRLRTPDHDAKTDPPCLMGTGKQGPKRRDNMAAVSTNDLKNGMTLNIPEGLFSVVEFQHVKPGKGGAFVRTKLKNLRTGAVIDRTYRADEKLDQAIIDKREMQFLYSDGGSYVFMDNSDYEQVTSPRQALGSAANFLKEGDSALLQFYDGEMIGVDLPAAVELTVTQTEPGVQGDRVSGARKPAVLETGLTVQVPLFVNQGDRVKVDTRSGEYLTRVGS